MSGDRPGARISAWRPSVTGIAEVFHAHFADHAYPVHTHDTWDLMILDDGAVDFAVDRHRHAAAGAGTVVLLPPGVPHDGRTVGPAGFYKRVIYLDTRVLPDRLAGAAVHTPAHADALLRRRIHQLHRALADPGDTFEAESRLALVRERLGPRPRSQPPDQHTPTRPERTAVTAAPVPAASTSPRRRPVRRQRRRGR
ncbi:AraC family ligand binding domain-containing protein [Streptomyces sp. NA04227]|uniref:AraC family ligand binding domain-containing protein n=1 Tax=Streptomyces sp. NA04227 TaxID=2742136 RepID=UPI0015901378|nr:AraC family ligand binding domain-containing protein [Streptomyces sp. NA04227]